MSSPHRRCRRSKRGRQLRASAAGALGVVILVGAAPTAPASRLAHPTVTVHVGCDGRRGAVPVGQNAAPVPGVRFASVKAASFIRPGRRTPGADTAVVAADPTPSGSLGGNATTALATMRSSAYAHTSLRYPVTDATYRTDCSGFASFLVNQTSPGTPATPFPALADLVQLGGKASADAGATSSQPRAYANQFEEVFGALGTGVTDRFWQAVTSPRDLQPGDLVSWLLPPTSGDKDTGHVMVAATAATLDPGTTFTATTCTTTGIPAAPNPTAPAPNYVYDCHGRRVGYYEYDVTVVDSSGPHGPRPASALNRTPASQIVAGQDSRNTNPINEPSAAGGRVPHSGVGEGQIGLLTLTPAGPAVAFLWYPNDGTGPKFYDTAPTSATATGLPNCPAGQLRPRPADTIPLVTQQHRSCVPGVTFGRLVATS